MAVRVSEACPCARIAPDAPARGGRPPPTSLGWACPGWCRRAGKVESLVNCLRTTPPEIYALPLRTRWKETSARAAPPALRRQNPRPRNCRACKIARSAVGIGPRTIGGQPLTAFRTRWYTSSWGCAARAHGPAEPPVPLRRRKDSVVETSTEGRVGGGPSAAQNRNPPPTATGIERRRETS